jgi:quercetin dioxygenase-like cupin family protein
VVNTFEHGRIITTGGEAGSAIVKHDSLDWIPNPSYEGMFRIPIDENESPPSVSMLTRIPEGGVVPMHRMYRGGPEAPADNPAVEYNIVLDGEVELSVEGGESARLTPGTVHVLRGTTHSWKAVDGDVTLFSVLTWQPIDAPGD